METSRHLHPCSRWRFAAPGSRSVRACLARHRAWPTDATGGVGTRKSYSRGIGADEDEQEDETEGHDGG
eukprot:44696-Pyramimonas_sp.AAC.1